MMKGVAAGTVNLVLALMLGASLPPSPILCVAALIGFLGYGVSLVLFVLALRHLGTARSGVYFSMAPFMGALLAIALFGAPLTVTLLLAGVLMAIGLWLHLTDTHAHQPAHTTDERNVGKEGV